MDTRYVFVFVTKLCYGESGNTIIASDLQSHSSKPDTYSVVLVN
jgi:hypothetical protein